MTHRLLDHSTYAKAAAESGMDLEPELRKIDEWEELCLAHFADHGAEGDSAMIHFEARFRAAILVIGSGMKAVGLPEGAIGSAAVSALADVLGDLLGQVPANEFPAAIAKIMRRIVEAAEAKRRDDMLMGEPRGNA